jgi:hypothetical protein
MKWCFCAEGATGQSGSSNFGGPSSFFCPAAQGNVWQHHITTTRILDSPSWSFPVVLLSTHAIIRIRSRYRPCANSATDARRCEAPAIANYRHGKIQLNRPQGATDCSPADSKRQDRCRAQVDRRHWRHSPGPGGCPPAADSA